MTKEKQNQKTHWLQSPNKNYLGHWDLPNGQDIILTIASAQWEGVKDPITKESESKRVIRFKENFKPFICNQTNAQTILKSTGENYMEDCAGKKIKLSVGKAKVAGETVDCIRIKNIPQEELQDKNIDENQVKELEMRLEEAGKDKIEFCKSMRIEILSALPASKFDKIINRLIEIKNQQQNETTINN